MTDNRAINLRADLLANDLLPELAALDCLSPEQREALDYALGHWVLQVLQRPADIDSLTLLDRLAASAQQCADGDDVFRSKLTALRDLLENKRLAVATRVSKPSRQLHHAQEIIGLLRAAGMHQQMLPSEIASRRRLEIGRVNGLLAVMEQDGLVERHRVGLLHWAKLSATAANT